MTDSPEKVLILFDVDGTLTPSRKVISKEMTEFLEKVAEKATISLVGGSDFTKIKEQMGGSEKDLEKFLYVFSENGLVARKNGQEFFRGNIQAHLGEDRLQKFINFTLEYLSKTTLPVKRGTFIEFRNGMLNVCPVGRSCSQEERDQFFLYDQEHKVREKMVAAMKQEFQDYGLSFVIGGQISMDVFPIGWDKRFCLKHIEKDGFTKIHFFGDKIFPGGNDYEIYSDERTIGHAVTSPDDTRRQLQALLNL